MARAALFAHNDNLSALDKFSVNVQRSIDLSQLSPARSTIFTSCDESQRPRPQGSGGSSPEQKEDNNLGQVRRPFGLSKEGLRAKGGEEEGGQNWRIQSNFFIVKASCVSE